MKKTGLTEQEIVDAMVPPVSLTTDEKKAADNALMAAREARRRLMTKEERQTCQLRKLRFQLEAYIREDHFKPEKSFGFFLDQYIKITERKQKEFASDINIHRTTVTNLIKNVKKPNSSLMIRLEIHSGNAIPAIDWLKLHEMEKGHELKTDQLLRERERKFVKRSVEQFR